MYARIYRFVDKSAKKVKTQYSRTSSNTSADHDCRPLQRNSIYINNQQGDLFLIQVKNV